MEYDYTSRQASRAGSPALIEREYVDDKGRKTRVRIPENETDYSLGIEIGPPPLDDLGLPEEIQTRLHNQLYNRGIFTFEDMRRNRDSVRGALMAALNVDVLKVAEIYRNALS